MCMYGIVLKSVSEGKLQGKKGQLQARLDNWIIIFSLALALALSLSLFATLSSPSTRTFYQWCMKSFRY
jgi:hypothetical protein